jgi:4-diphosphocytidyl-2-C-methyl-D-erythritol kinase
MIAFPKAKINIGLSIVRRRDDGFHDIETVFYPTRFTDALEFVVAGDEPDADEITVTGIDSGCRSEDNLVIKAVKLLRETNDIPWLRIHLHKMIPPGSGLGGGSSDASTMLMLLNRYFNLQAGTQDLQSIALRLGSDCPFFIQGAPVLATGRGEIFSSLPCFLNGYYLIIIRENIHISTPLAYSNSKPRGRASGLGELIMTPVEEWKDAIKNDFEEYAFREYPALAKIKKAMYDSGAIYSSMSGSGSAIYGIFTSKPYTLPAGKIIWQGWL